MKTIAPILFLALLLTLAPRSMAESPVEWLIAPYGWLPDIGLKQSGGSTGDGGSGSVSGSDLLDKTDATGMIRVEAARDRWGLMFDYIFIDLSESSVIQTPGPIIPDINVRAGLDLTVVELGAFYRPSADEQGLQYMLGYRRIDAEKSLVITPGDMAARSIDGDAGLDDVFLGARYIHRVNKALDLTLRGDYSFGESEGVVNLLASAGYRFFDTFALQAGYRYVVLEYEESSEGVKVNTQIDLSGPFIGLAFRF